MSGKDQGWFRIQLGSLDQWITLVSVRIISGKPRAGKSLTNPNSAVLSRLIADLDPDDWDFPPKPKWMRWGTYNRYSDRYDRYEDVLDHGLIALSAKFLEKIISFKINGRLQASQKISILSQRRRDTNVASDEQIIGLHH